MSKRKNGSGESRMAQLAQRLKELARQPDLDRLLEFILSHLTEALSADRGVLFLLDENHNTLRISGTAGVDDVTIAGAAAVSRTVVNRVAASKTGVFTAAAISDGRFKDSASVQLHGIRSLMCVPLTYETGLQGVIYLDSLKREGVFGENDYNYAEIFAKMAAYEIERQRRSADNGSSITTDGTVASKASDYKIVGSSAVIRDLRANIAAAARGNLDVLVVGESGTGKELAVRLLHALSANAAEPFVGINCAAIPDELLESELFGIEKGTATGVDKRVGLFERAGEGTILLDEVGAMDFSTQAKLIRVLQERQFSRLGSRNDVPINLRARVVSATNIDLPRAIAAGAFREDFYHRLNVFQIKCPPLRDHKEDIPGLLDYFIERYWDRAARRRPEFSAEVANVLTAYDWPGNVRELENCVRVALNKSKTRIMRLADLPYQLQEEARRVTDTRGVGLGGTLARIERDIVLNALRESNWVITKAAARLGVSETGLRYKMSKLTITESDRFPVE